jgi:hypothetical protein
MGNRAGIDWASEKHDVLIEDPASEELLATTFRHDEDGVGSPPSVQGLGGSCHWCGALMPRMRKRGRAGSTLAVSSGNPVAAGEDLGGLC